MLLRPAQSSWLRRSVFCFIACRVNFGLPGTPGMKEGIRAGSSGVPRAGELPGKPRHMLAAEEVHVVHELIHDVFLILYEGKKSSQGTGSSQGSYCQNQGGLTLKTSSRSQRRRINL
jgi:hypothetical protein